MAKSAVTDDVASAISESGQTVNDKINQAIKLVNEAKEQTVNSTRNTIRRQLDDGRERFDQIKDQAMTRFEDSRSSAEESIKTRPFAFVMGATIIGVLLGYVLGSKR